MEFAVLERHVETVCLTARGIRCSQWVKYCICGFCQFSKSTCGDGQCVEGENCQNCPQDCNGNLNTTNITETEKYCCGWDDLYSPDGCGDSRCSSGTKTCITYACEGLNRRSQSTASNVRYSWTTTALSIASTGIAFALFNIL
eukprot:scaffold341444_cov51-Attheya_sp.AAC.1